MNMYKNRTIYVHIHSQLLYVCWYYGLAPAGRISCYVPSYRIIATSWYTFHLHTKHNAYIFHPTHGYMYHLFQTRKIRTFHDLSICWYIGTLCHAYIWSRWARQHFEGIPARDIRTTHERRHLCSINWHCRSFGSLPMGTAIKPLIFSLMRIRICKAPPTAYSYCIDRFVDIYRVRNTSTLMLSTFNLILSDDLLYRGLHWFDFHKVITILFMITFLI